MFLSIISAILNFGVPLTCVSVDGLGKSWSALHILDATVQQPWFVVLEQLIFCISDMRHLIKCLRNALIKYFLETVHGTVKKEYIDYFVHFDMTVQPRMAPKLTEAHLY